ncbi:signal peptidase I [Desulfitobacterium sp.]|uniref:signal peptidase I n=1 Tax=Desulfitobacterium sp. TaxID=49981 RepID=UPI002B1F0237|nr:signal peptidase I [Desulfitobacterium sp.]MEA4900182.1 signal peptidase I [Desulfitobacterium sp.]
MLRKMRLSGLTWTLIGIVILGILLRLFVLQPYLIPSGSMEPGIVPGDRILVNRQSYRLGAPSRGDIVVFAYPRDPSRSFVKRIIAVEGETVELKDNQVFINGQLVDEPYLKAGDYPPFGAETIPKDNVFVLGDNRRQSEDSREWGVLPHNYIIGKAVMIYYPLQRIKLLR